MRKRSEQGGRTWPLDCRAAAVVVEDQQNMNIRRKTCCMYVLTPSFTTGAPAARWPPTSFWAALAPLSLNIINAFSFTTCKKQMEVERCNREIIIIIKRMSRALHQSISPLLADTVRPKRRPRAPEEKRSKNQAWFSALKERNHESVSARGGGIRRRPAAGGQWRSPPKWRPLIRPKRRSLSTIDEAFSRKVNRPKGPPIHTDTADGMARL